MTPNPFNQLPLNAEWVHQVDAAVKRAAADVGCMVVMVVIQENGKLGVVSSGVPAHGPLSDLLDDLPTFFAGLAVGCAASDAHDDAAPRN